MQQCIETSDMNEDEEARERHYFKYMSRTTGKIVLKNHTLRWSTPGTLNDPYDAQFDLQVDLDANVLRPLIVNKMWGAYLSVAPVSVGNRLSDTIRMLSNSRPGMSREEFEESFQESIERTLQNLPDAARRFHESIRPWMARTKILCHLCWAGYPYPARIVHTCEPIE